MFIVVDANELSQRMVRLASPFTVLVQRSLRSPMPIHDRILETTTAFVGSLCRAVSQYQHAYVTERVLAVIWFIVTLVYDSGNLSRSFFNVMVAKYSLPFALLDQKSVQQLCDALSSWVKTLDQEQYAVVLAGFIAQADRMVDQEREHIYLTLLATTVQASTQCKYCVYIFFSLTASNFNVYNSTKAHCSKAILYVCDQAYHDWCQKTISQVYSPSITLYGRPYR